MPLTERARLEPSLNAGSAICSAQPDSDPLPRRRRSTPTGTVLDDGGGPVEGVVTLADLRVQPIDFVYMVRSQVERDRCGGARDARALPLRARHAAWQTTSVVRIAFADAGGDP